jgi:hypothetical protein
LIAEISVRGSSSSERNAWLVIEPFAITGRRLRPAEREWAFHARAYL